MTMARTWPRTPETDPTTVTLRLAEETGAPPAARLGKLCRQLDIGYRLLAGEPVVTVTGGPDEVAEVLAAEGGLSVTPPDGLDERLDVAAVASGDVLSVRLTGGTEPLLGVLALCGATFRGDGSVADAETLDAALDGLADGIGTLKQGLGPAD